EGFVVGAYRSTEGSRQLLNRAFDVVPALRSVGDEFRISLGHVGFTPDSLAAVGNIETRAEYYVGATEVGGERHCGGNNKVISVVSQGVSSAICGVFIVCREARMTKREHSIEVEMVSL